MNLAPIDWAIVIIVLLLVLLVGQASAGLMRSVADFLAANRCSGRYLLTMASGMTGSITIVAQFEKFYETGFGGMWWDQMLAPVMLILALSGFVVYRFRESRALTLAQFFEARYSRNFRIFSGMLIWFSGILNFGVFPAVTTRLLIYLIGFPETISVLNHQVSIFPIVMAFMLGIAVYLTLVGGLIATMITDFLQGQFVNIVMLAILGYFAFTMSWGDLIEGLRMAPEGQSRINPFEQGKMPDFNVWFFVMMAVMQIYSYRSWQGGQGYAAAPKSPHEARMANILGEFRGLVSALLVIVLPICAFAVLHLPAYAAEQQQVGQVLSGISDPQTQKQMLVPITLATILPAGLLGLLVSVMISATTGTNTTYLHSWGSIFAQDIVMPFRKRPLSPRSHIRLLRFSILGVAVFAFFWSLYFPLNEYIFMYFSITGSIYLGGAGAVLLGGLYWKRGSVEGAWAALVSGCVLSLLGICLRNIIWPHFLPGWQLAAGEDSSLAFLPREFPLNGMQMAFATAIISAGLYVICSLISRRAPVDMQRLLHRGEYAREIAGHHPEITGNETPGPTQGLRTRMWRRLGVGPDFTRGDKWIYLLKITWVMFFFGVFVAGTVLAAFVKIPEHFWISWWGFKLAITAALGVVSVVWFLVGGMRDLRDLIRTLKDTKRNSDDDGRVPLSEHLQG